MCVDGSIQTIEGVTFGTQAMCVGEGDWQTVVHTMSADYVDIMGPWTGPIPPKTTVQAILTAAENPAISVTAAKMTMQAQSVREIFGARSYTTLDGGLASCTNCERVGMYPVPKGTQHWLIDVVLPVGVTAARLYLPYVTG